MIIIFHDLRRAAASLMSNHGVPCNWFFDRGLPALPTHPNYPPEQVRRAIITGVFEGSGCRYPCESEVQEATSMMLNRIADTYQRIAGGALNWDSIILTGGGSALLYPRLLPAY